MISPDVIQNGKISSGYVTQQPLWARIVLLFVLGYEAAGGLLGGALLIAAPDGRLMDMPVNMMHGIFQDFLIPGIILSGMGLLSTFAFVEVLRKKYNDWFLATLTLGGWFIWFNVEIIIIKELHWLHIMWALPVLLGCVVAIPLIAAKHPSPGTKKFLLACGLLSSLWYVFMNIYVPTQNEGYSMVTYTPSELSAIESPTRILWVLLSTAYPLLFAAFGWGIREIAEGKRSLRILCGIIIAYCIFNFYWPPMHMRGAEMALTDTFHIVWAAITVTTMMVMMGFGAAAMNKQFRIYTIATFILFIVFGSLTGMESPGIATNTPTLTIGIWERINIFLFLQWVGVLSILLLKRTRDSQA